VLAFAATGDRATAVLTGPVTVARTGPDRSLQQILVDTAYEVTPPALSGVG
jgi:hypothetical protein